jgi:hypothetical protein
LYQAITLITLKINIMKKLILTFATIATLISCSTEDMPDVIIDSNESTESNETTNPINYIVGNWTHIKDEVYYDWGVDVVIIQCGGTIDVTQSSISNDLNAETANCIGGGIRYRKLIELNSTNVYMYEDEPDTFVKIEGLTLTQEDTGDSQRVVSIYRKN